MRVCDITRNDEVVATATVTIGLIRNDEDSTVHELDLGSAAYKALLDQDWGALAALVPAKLRTKDDRRSAAAKKAAVTRQANKQQKANTAPPAAPGGSQTPGGATGAAAPAESDTGGPTATEEDPDAWLHD